MKHSKKLHSLVFCLAILFSVFTYFGLSSFAAEVDANGIEYVTYDTGYAISKATKATGNYTVPSEFNGESVIKIGNSAFANNNNITSIYIPSSIKKIEASAFANCTNLLSVEFESSNTIVTFDEYAFTHCDTLSNIVFPKNISLISAHCFEYCSSIKSINIPDSTYTIGNTAFGSCTGLTTVNISANVSTIEGGAFKNCANLVNIYVDANNEYYKSANGVLFSKDGTELVQYPIGLNSTTYKVPNTVTKICNCAFANSKLQTINLPNSISYIDDFAFQQSSALSKITLPESLTYIGADAFQECYSLKSLTIPSNLNNYENAFSDSGLVTVTIKSGVSKIPLRAFNNCKDLTDVYIPVSVNSIESGAFQDIKGNILPKLNLHVEKDSYAYSYAIDKGLNFTLNSDEPKIVKYTKNRTEGYKTSITFYADYDKSSGAKLIWLYNGKEYNDNGSSSFKVSTPIESYTIGCRVKLNDQTKDSDVEIVTIKNNFFAKIVYFFKSIFSSASLNIEQK